MFPQKRRWDAYERLPLDVIEGDSTLPRRRDEVEAACLIDPILKGWQDNYQDPRPYPAGRNGPSRPTPCWSWPGASGKTRPRHHQPYNPLPFMGGAGEGRPCSPDAIREPPPERERASLRPDSATLHTFFLPRPGPTPRAGGPAQAPAQPCASCCAGFCTQRTDGQTGLEQHAQNPRRC